MPSEDARELLERWMDLSRNGWSLPIQLVHDTKTYLARTAPEAEEARKRWAAQESYDHFAQPPPRSSAQGAREVAERAHRSALLGGTIADTTAAIDAYASALAAEQVREALEKAERAVENAIGNTSQCFAAVEAIRALIPKESQKGTHNPEVCVDVQEHCETLCRIYFEIASEAVGEEKVRKLRDQRLGQGG